MILSPVECLWIANGDKHVDPSQYVGDTRGNITRVKYAVRDISIHVCISVGGWYVPQ